MLSGFDIVPAGGSGPPGVKLYIYLKVKENLATADADNVTEYLVASDYSKINKYGSDRANAWDASPPPARVPTIEVCLETWERNLWQYFLNYADCRMRTCCATHHLCPTCGHPALRPN
ncbi:hypothetical protein DSCO28_09690 [Desulfosarcina ovata subsp. sediminis]|uniref:Uncharacterized protein n=2 Tax=Desulfosarcina ovata TaxID=83564 RepID=A0A5K7ZR17_9BACT|nr:hypothetical protein DSCO28_09690 [Desulfosarcina ovata subsp. sediminis]